MRLCAIGTLFLLMLAGTAAQNQKPVFPDLIPLPDGFAPEGIAVGNGTTFFVGSGLGSPPQLGQILVGDLRTGAVSQLVAPTKQAALGIKFDSRSKLIFVAGGPSGTGRVYNSTSGVEVVAYQFKVPSPTARTNVNDVIVTRDAAYFTDSVNPELYRVAIGKQNQPEKTFESIPLPAVFGPPSGACTAGGRANGIAAEPNGKHLIIANSNVGQLFRMDTATRNVVPIKLTGGNVCNADGLLLDGKTLYVSQSTDNKIAVIDISNDLSSGAIQRHITEPFTSNPKTKVPTTIAEFGSSLYVVTGGFAPPAPDFVVRLAK